MLILSKRLLETPVMSLQTGAEVAKVSQTIIDPGILEIVAYVLTGPRVPQVPTILLTRDIREVGSMGFIIDSADELVPLKDVIKVHELSKLHFNLINMNVFDDASHKLGKIYDYAIDPVTFTVHQLYVKRPLLKSLQTSELVINRSQIVEITNTKIIVKSASLEEKVQPAALGENFINPFRKPNTPTTGSSSDNQKS